MNVKVIAFYLPQFHSIPENDKWWGKGFTEWINTKKSKSLFEGHNQPREPLNDYYYNLLDSETRKWQANIAKEYGIYGFCYYHYWFDGKLLLEKPLEQIRDSKEPDFPFCMCWANEPWTRAWDGGEKEVLMPQSYGDRGSWNRHLEYLLPFFKDERYIKIDNKPVFVIYRSAIIKNCNEMINFWDNQCKENGLGGIYIVEEVNGHQSMPVCSSSRAVVEFEPMFTMKADLGIRMKFYRKIRSALRKVLNIKLLDTYNYDFIWKRIIKREACYDDKKKFLGAFVDWDNTARRGNRAMIFKGTTYKKFENYFKLQFEKAKKNNTEFIFINAWNEWAEGTYLEPDKKNEYKYLEAIKNAKE